MHLTSAYGMSTVLVPPVSRGYQTTISAPSRCFRLQVGAVAHCLSLVDLNQIFTIHFGKRESQHIVRVRVRALRFFSRVALGSWGKAEQCFRLSPPIVKFVGVKNLSA
jgi:hypothetical protein